MSDTEQTVRCKRYPQCGNWVSPREAQIPDRLLEEGVINREVYTSLHGLCKADIRDFFARRKITVQDRFRNTARDENRDKRLKGANRRQPDEITASEIGGFLAATSAAVRSWLVEPGYLGPHRTSFDGRYVYVTKEEFLTLIDRLEDDDPELRETIPDYLRLKWQARIPQIREKIANGALGK